MKHKAVFTSKSTYGKNQKQSIGIRTKMYAIIVVFIVCVLISIWFLQVGMLSFFYQNTKFSELEDSANTIYDALGMDTEVDDVAQGLSDDYALDVWVMRMRGTEVEWMVKHSSTGVPALAMLSQELDVLYAKAVANGGIYMATVPIDQFSLGSSFKVLKDNLGERDEFPGITSYDTPIGTLYIRVESVEGVEYMVLQFANLTPLQTTMNLLRNQFTFIGFAMLLIALVLVAFISKMITKPFLQMTEAAKRLAEGNYDVAFTGHGYREINELAQTLNYASCELAKTDNLQKELISNISHDLRTPLTMIKGYGEVMRDIPGENTSENVQVIIDETTRLSELVNDMLDLSRIQSGTRALQYQCFNITEVIRDTLLRYEKLRMQDGYDIDFVVDRDAYVLADRGMILQVIYNLINNAINYTGDDKKVVVRQECTDRSVKISIIDTGMGIEPEHLTEIWQRYYRLDKVHKRATVGTGLGLSIVKEALEAHSALYGVESAVGEGATFWFELSLTDMPEVLDVKYDSNENEDL